MPTGNIYFLWSNLKFSICNSHHRQRSSTSAWKFGFNVNLGFSSCRSMISGSAVEQIWGKRLKKLRASCTWRSDVFAAVLEILDLQFEDSSLLQCALLSVEPRFVQRVVNSHHRKRAHLETSAWEVCFNLGFSICKSRISISAIEQIWGKRLKNLRASCTWR